MAHRLLYIKFVQMLAVLLVFSSAVAHAVSMGEIAIKSHWGEPLRAQVDLHIDANEIVNESCLSVVMPDAQVEDASAYLTKISLEVKSLEDKPFALISTREPFNEMFAKVKLQIKCSSMASITKTFTILPEFDVVGSVSPAVVNVSAASVPQPPIVSADAVAAPSATEVVSVTQQKAKISTRPARVRGATPHQKIKSHTTSSLKVSGQLDAAAINSLSKINKDELLAKLKTLNSDDQIAAMLAMQYQIKQLSEELADIKLRISPASAVAPAVPQAASVVAAKAPALPVAPETSYRFWLLAACVVLIGLLVAVRFLNQKKKSVLASFETE